MKKNENYKAPMYEVREIKTIKEMIYTGAELFGYKEAFLVKERKGASYKDISYRRFKNDVEALGTELIALGLAGEKIAVIGENSYEWVVSYMATVCGVGTVVPIDKELSQEEIYNLIETAECKAVFYSSTYEKYFKGYDIAHKFKFEMYRNEEVPYSENDMEQLIYRGRKLITEGDRRYTDIKVDPEAPNIFLFTSGTTGVPKAVMLCHRNIVSNVMDVARIVKLRDDDRTLSILPIHHTFESTIGIMEVLYQGGSIAFYEGLKYVTKNLAEAQATVLVGVPLIFESIYEKIWKQAKKSHKTKALTAAVKLNKSLQRIGVDKRQTIFKSVYEKFGGRLRLIITGAAALNPAVFRGFMDLGFEIAQGYGLTETSPLVSGTPDETSKYKKSGSVGGVVPSGELRIDDPNEEGIGEIMFKGPNVMLGYYNMPEETAEVFTDGWFHTGDLGFIDENDWLYITGRKKNVIVTKTGKNVYPEELESRINDLATVSECMVYGTRNTLKTANDTEIAVQIRPDFDAVGAKYGEDRSDEQLYELFRDEISTINAKLPSYKRVKKIIVRKEDFIKTTTQKIKRQANIEG